MIDSDSWSGRAELLQDSLEKYFGAGGCQLLNNSYPLTPGDNDVFNYWWLAHAIEARLDAYERTGDARRLDEASEIFRNVLARNGGTLFNDYFDDMGWLGIALVRLAELAASPGYLQQAADLWRHIRDLGWNEDAGGGIAWRKSQLGYKNTPANATFIILGTRLHRRTGEAEYLDWSLRAFRWQMATLRRADGFVEDGINREGDGRIDTAWRFTYNQGLVMGACAELATVTGNGDLIEAAFATEAAAHAELARDGVLVDVGDGGDEGLFKAVWYRYAAQLAASAGTAHPQTERLVAHLVAGCESLWRRGLGEGSLLAGTDWRYPAPAHVPLSAQLAAIIATEACARVAQ